MQGLKSTALARSEVANLGRRSRSCNQRGTNRLALLATPRPAVAARAAPGRVQGEEHVAHLLVTDRAPVGSPARRGRGAEIPANRFRIQPQLRSKAFTRRPRFRVAELL